MTSGATAYYNEPDPVAAEWLRRLITAGLIASGEVDERDIRDVAPAELVRFTQCHFFAGIGIWSAALRRAGWSDDRPVWTGSCPCQPFSAAGSGGGFDDERHLWPHWHWLIEQCRPDVVIGEQVAGRDGLGWLDLVSDDLAGIGYASGAVALAAAGFGMGWRGSAEQARVERAVCLCPDPVVARHLGSFADWADQSLSLNGNHIRQRLYFVGLGDSKLARLEGLGGDGDDWHQPGRHGAEPDRPTAASGDAFGLGDTKRERFDRSRVQGGKERAERGGPDVTGRFTPAFRLADPDGGKPRSGSELGGGEHGFAATDREPAGAADSRRAADRQADAASAPDRRRGDADWLLCRDGVWRPARPGTFPLADAAPGRMGQLRAFGNGLDLETAAAFCVEVRSIVEGADA